MSGKVYYDGDCRMCAALAERLGPLLARRGYVFRPLKEEADEMRVLPDGGRPLGGADAIVFLASLYWWARPFALAARLPGALPVLRAGYRWIAARRSCRHGACRLPAAKLSLGWLPLLLAAAAALRTRGRWTRLRDHGRGVSCGRAVPSFVLSEGDAAFHGGLMVALLRVAGVVHLIIIGANLALPGILDFKGELGKLSPIVRQIFLVHHAYIMLILILFSALCLGFPEELAGASRLGTFLCGFMAFFWLTRLPVQFFFYDPEIKRRHPLGHWAFTFALASISAVLSVAAVRGLI